MYPKIISTSCLLRFGCFGPIHCTLDSSAMKMEFAFSFNHSLAMDNQSPNRSCRQSGCSHQLISSEIAKSKFSDFVNRWNAHDRNSECKSMLFSSLFFFDTLIITFNAAIHAVCLCLRYLTFH